MNLELEVFMDMEFVYETLADGSVRQFNPMAGLNVLSVPGREARPITNQAPQRELPLWPAEGIEDYCDFCLANPFKTTMEKSRLVADGTGFKVLRRVEPEDYSKSLPLFRRVPNLFEIISTDYWKKNHGFELSKDEKAWKERYLGSPLGRRHVMDLLEYKLTRAGLDAEANAIADGEKMREMADAFFGGSHELVLSGRHYREGAQTSLDLYSAAVMTPEEHYRFFYFTVDSLAQIMASQPYARNVVVFQNWLSEAGASFDHLHKQVMALDEWGGLLLRLRELLALDKHFFNSQVLRFAREKKLVLAENGHAVAMVEAGQAFPTACVYMKARHTLPQECSQEALRGFSDLVQACHAACGPGLASNEEWIYSPKNFDVPLPWHVRIKWRTHKTAGFEGATEVFINPFPPLGWKQRMLGQLLRLREQGSIAPMKLGEECTCEPGCLEYDTNY